MIVDLVAGGCIAAFVSVITEKPWQRVAIFAAIVALLGWQAHTAQVHQRYLQTLPAAQREVAEQQEQEAAESGR